MFWRILGFIGLLWSVIAFGLAQHRWTERMLARVNAERPFEDQLQFWTYGPFQVLELHQQFRRLDPAGYWRAMIRFALTAVVLLVLMLSLMIGAG